MTEEEKAQLRELKGEVTERLARIDPLSFRLDDTDGRLVAYTREVIAHPEGHNLWEQLSVERFFRFCEGYTRDEKAARRFFKFYESLHFPGKKGLTRYALTPVQVFQFANVYLFRRDDGRRLTRECVLYVPRKFSKTTGTSAFAIYDLLLGESNAEVYIGANSQLQAKKCFDVIRGSLRKLDNLGRRYVINEEVVKPTAQNPRKAFAQCLTANARTKDGLEASTVIMDEFSQARDSQLLTVLTTSMGTRSEPLTVIITTASDVFDGPFYPMLAGYKDVLSGKVEDDTLFAHLFEPDVDDAEDAPATWRKVHPHLGVTIQKDFYEFEWAKAQRNGAEARLAFRTKLLNVYTDNEMKSWISAALARSISRPMQPGLLAGSPATVAIDLSVRGDFSAVTLGLYDEEKMCNHYITKYFFPRGGLDGHPNENLYRTWAAAGHLRLQDSEVIDYREIVEYVLGLSSIYDIVAIGYDAYKSMECVNMIGATDVGYALRPVSQTQGAFMSPVQSFEVGVRTGHIFINDNPINHYCFGNAVLLEDSNGNQKPFKRSENDRIDGVITMLMAHKLFVDSRRALL